MGLPYTRDYLADLIAAGYDIEVGARTYGHPVIHWTEKQKTAHRLRIGDYCSIADRVVVYVGTRGRHALDFVTTYPVRQLYPSQVPRLCQSAHVSGDLSVTIGSDVWIGREVLILSGVTIGHGAVIGARSVVTRDVAPYDKVVGAPARSIGSRFAPDVVAALLDLAWWELPEEVIAENVDALDSPNIAGFLKRMAEVKRRVA